MKYFWRAVLSLMLLLPLVFLFALFTEWGSRSLLNTIDGLTPLEIEYGGGSVSSQLRINRLLFTTDGLVLELHDLVAELVPGCLWRSALCFSQLQASSLDLAILPGEDSEKSQAEAPDQLENAELIAFPVTLETDVLALSSARIRWQGGEWRQGAAQVQLRINGSTIEIINAEIDAAYLELIEQGEAEDPASNTISLPRIDLPLALEVDQLLLRQPSWNVYGAQHSHQTIELQGDWRNAELRLEHLGIAEKETGELALQGELTFDAQWPLHIAADIKLGEPPSWPQLHGRAIMLSVTGSLADLTLALSSAGIPALSADAQLNALDRKIPFTTTLKLTSPEQLPLADIAEVPAQFADAGIEFPLVVTATGSIAQQQFNLQGAASGLGYPSMALLLDGRHEQGHITLQQFQLQDSAGTNDLRATGEITVAPQLQFSLALLSAGIEFPRLGDAVAGRLQGGLQVSGSLLDEAWQVAIADVDLQGSVNDLPASINGYAGIGADTLLTESKLNAQINGAQLALNVGPGSGQSGRIELSVADLGRWQPGSRGQLQLQATLAADRRQLDVTTSLRDVQWQDVQVRQGTVSGNYRGVENPAFKLNALFDDVDLAGRKLSSLQLLLDGTAAKHSIAVQARGDVEGRLAVSGALSGAISGALPGDQWRGKLAPTTLETPQGPWQLSEAVAMDWSQATGQLRLSAHCWRQQQTRLCPGELALGRQASGSLEIAGDMGFISRLLPEGLDLQGDMQLRLQGSWDPDKGALLSGRSQTSALLLTQGFGEGESASVGWDKGAAVFDYDKNGLKLKWEIFRGGRRIADLNLLLPPDRGQALVGAVNFEQLQLATMAPFAPTLSRLEGELSGRLQLSGTTDVPLAHGLLSLSGGRMAMVGNPTELAGLDLSLDLQGDWAQLRGSGLLGGGQLSLDGELRSEPELQLVLQVKGEQHNILYPPSTELVISENLQFEVLKELIQVTGELIVEEGELKFEQLPEGSVALSNDVVQVDYMGNVVREEFPLDVGMDVWVRIRDRFKVTGSLLETTLGGDLHLQQQPGQPLQLFGNLATRGGEVRAYQQRLSLDWGVISFSGPPDNPLLDIRAQRKFTSSGVTAGVQVQGQLQGDLELEVFTDPVMSPNEAMSYLVRGRGLDSGAGADGTAVALSVAGGVVNRSTLVSELNRIPGVSNIEFGATGTEEEDTAATVGGYIGERLYLSYGFGLYEPINVLTARLYLGTRWWLEVVSRLENSVDMYYSFDIE